MLDWTDRHCRYFHRLISRHTWLYTEMVTTGALLYGDVARHLDFSGEEHPVALQLGGSEPADLAQCARLGEKWGYDEINLNCGCPSERVQKGAFGACLMKESTLVANCVKAMKDAVSIDVTVKHRIGIDDIRTYSFVRDFIGEIAGAGCQTFIVHARNAMLKGLSPKENRKIPPLRYDVVYRLKKDFPDLEILINGGVETADQVEEHLKYVDGVMIGRAAEGNPWIFREVVSYLENGTIPARPTNREKREMILRHAALQLEYKGEYTGVREMRKHLSWYTVGMPHSAHFRQTINTMEKMDELIRGVQEIFPDEV